MTYEQIIQQAGKEIEVEVNYTENGTAKIIDYDNIKRVRIFFNTGIIGTIMKGIELELSQSIPDVPITLKVTAKYENNTATKVYSNYHLKETPTYNADKKTYTHLLYDEILNWMVDYEPIEIEYPTTVIQYFKKLVQTMGCTTNINSLPNGNKMIESDIYNGINYTYRDVLDDIGQATATLFKVTGNQVQKCTFGTTTKVLDDDILKNQNISMGQHYGPINVVVLSRGADADRIYYPETLPSNPKEYRIIENQLMNGNDRNEWMPAIYNELNGIEYDIYDCQLVGYGGFNPLDKLKIQTYEGDTLKTYNSYVFNNEIVITQGYEESIYNNLEDAEGTNYKYSDTTDKRINQTNLIVNKQEHTIEALVSTTTEQQETIEKIVNSHRNISGDNHLYLEDAIKTNATEYVVEGKCEQKTSAQGKNLFDKNNANIINGYINGNRTMVAGNYRTLYFKGKPNTTYTIQKPLSDRFRINTCSIEPEIGTVFETANINKDNATTYTLTTDSNNIYILIWFWQINDSLTEQEILDSIQIEEGTVAHDYEPFIPNSPSPEYPSEIETIHGVTNLFDKNKYGMKRTNSSKFATTDNSNTTRCRTDSFPFFNSGTYTISGFPNYVTLNNNFVKCYDENETYLGDGAGYTKNENSFTITNDNVKYINILFNGTDLTDEKVNNWNLLLEPGTVAHDYVLFGTWQKVKVTGKNLFNVGKDSSRLLNVTTVYNDSEYTMNGTTSASGNLIKTVGNKANYLCLGKFEAGTYYVKKYNSGNVTIPSGVSFATYIRDENNQVLKSWATTNALDTTLVLSEDTNLYLQVYTNGASIVFNNFSTKIQLEDGNTATNYESYKETEVLIDLNNNNNFFDKNMPVNASFYAERIVTDTGIEVRSTQSSQYTRVQYLLNLDTSKTYTLSYNFRNPNQNSIRTIIYTNATTSTVDVSSEITNAESGSHTITFTPKSSEILIRFYSNILATYSESDVFYDDLQIKGKNLYYELCSTKDLSVRDRLSITNESTNIIKNLGKYVFTGDENGWGYTERTKTFWCNTITNFIKDGGFCFSNYYKFNGLATVENNSCYIGTAAVCFVDHNIANLNNWKNYLKNLYNNGNPLCMIYPLAEPYTIKLPNISVPLFEEINHVTLENDIGTNTSITYERQTPISDSYITRTETNALMKITSNQILEEVNETTTEISDNLEVMNERFANQTIDLNGISNAVSQIQTTVNNNNQALNEKFNNYATNNSVTQQINTVSSQITSTQASLNILERRVENGVDSVTTSTGYTFGANGLNIGSTNSKVNNTLNETGMNIRDNTTNETLLFAGYDTETQETIVKSKNMTVEKYLNVPHARFESYNNPNHGTGTGCFYRN